MEIEEVEMLIYKYLLKKITQEEERCLLDWLNASPENMQLFLEMKAIHRILNFYYMEPQRQYKQINRSLNKLKKQVDASSLNRKNSE